MKTIRIFAVMILLAMTPRSFSQFSKFVENRQQIVDELKKNFTGILYESAHNCGFYKFSICGDTVKDNLIIYSYKSAIDTTITNFALYEYYKGKTVEFLVITVVENGVSEIFIDLNFDGTLDQCTINGKTFCGLDMLIEQKNRFDQLLEFGVRG